MLAARSAFPTATRYLSWAFWTAGTFSLPTNIRAQEINGAAVDIVSPLANSSPQLRFHEGQVANNQPLLDPVLPAVPGPVSNWVLTQWNHTVYLHPADLRAIVAPAFSPMYEAVASDTETMVFIRHEIEETGFIFTLYNSNGVLTSSGGRSLYLSQNASKTVDSNFDDEIDLSLDVRVVEAAVDYTYPNAESTGAVLAMAYTGIGLLFTDPTTRLQQFIFMQIGLTHSGATSAPPTFLCSGDIPTIYQPPVAVGAQLPFSPDFGPLHHLTYNLTSLLTAMLAVPKPCGGTTSPWTPTMLDPSNWKFTNIYIGSETENTDDRPGAAIKGPQGSASLALDLANLSVKRAIRMPKL